MKVLGLHRRDTANVGDLASCPVEYFEFPGHEKKVADIASPPRGYRPDLVIYGGGSIIASPMFHQWPGLTVAWGVGHHVRVPPWHAAMDEEHRRAGLKCNLYFPRDEVAGFMHVPCASCMHPVFDEPLPGPICDVVRYSAARRIRVQEPRDAPGMSNIDGTIEESVRFLAQGRMVITSSYHGAYWALLLGRKVALMPWGSKFEYLPSLELEPCREANRRAYAAVLNLLEAMA